MTEAVRPQAEVRQQPPTAVKDEERVDSPPELPEGEWATQHLHFSQAILISDFWSPALSENKVLLF